MKKYQYCVIAFIFMLGVSANADYMLNVVDKPVTISLVDALNLAIKRNYDLQKFEQNIFATQGEAQIATSKVLPRVSAKANHQLGSSKQRSMDTEGAKAGVETTIPLLDAKALIDMKAKRENVASSKEKFRHEKDALARDVSMLYIDAAIAKFLSDNAKEEQELYKKQLALVESKSQVQKARNLDLGRAQYHAAKAESDFVEKLQVFQKKMGELGRKIGTHDFFLLDNVLIDSPYLTKDASALVEIAQGAFDISMIKKDISAASFAMRAEYFEFFPKFFATLDLGWNFASQQNVIAASSPNFSVTTMLNVELPLFSGGATFGALKSLAAKKTMHELTMRMKTDEKSLTINSLLTEISNLERVKNSALLAVNAAKLARDSAERMFINRAATGLELVEANTNHFTAKNLLVNTTLQIEKAKVQLLFVIGRMSEIL